jgi:UPF0176 protein
MNTLKNKSTFCVVALYRFVALDNYTDLRAPLLDKLKQLEICGTLLLAAEGINGTVAGSDTNIDALLNWLETADCWQGRL